MSFCKIPSSLDLKNKFWQYGGSILTGTIKSQEKEEFWFVKQLSENDFNLITLAFSRVIHEKLKKFLMKVLMHKSKNALSVLRIRQIVKKITSRKCTWISTRILIGKVNEFTF